MAQCCVSDELLYLERYQELAVSDHKCTRYTKTEQASPQKMKSIGWWTVCSNVVPARFDKFHHCHQTFHLLVYGSTPPWSGASATELIKKCLHFSPNRYWISLEELAMMAVPHPSPPPFPFCFFAFSVVFLSSDLFNQAQKYDIKTHSAIMKARIVSQVLDFFNSCSTIYSQEKTRKVTKIDSSKSSMSRKLIKRQKKAKIVYSSDNLTYEG